MSELKVHRIIGLDEQCASVESDYYLKSDADKVIAEKNKETARLEAIREVHVEAIASMEDRLHQDEKKIRKLCRALWIARAMRAEAQWNRQLRDAGIAFAIGENKSWDSWNQKQKKWQGVERKCKAKAEEYK